MVLHPSRPLGQGFCHLAGNDQLRAASADADESVGDEVRVSVGRRESAVEQASSQALPALLRITVDVDLDALFQRSSEESTLVV